MSCFLFFAEGCFCLAECLCLFLAEKLWDAIVVLLVFVCRVIAFIVFVSVFVFGLVLLLGGEAFVSHNV